MDSRNANYESQQPKWCDCGLTPKHSEWEHDWCCQNCGGSHSEEICPEKNKELEKMKYEVEFPEKDIENIVDGHIKQCSTERMIQILGIIKAEKESRLAYEIEGWEKYWKFEKEPVKKKSNSKKTGSRGSV